MFTDGDALVVSCCEMPEDGVRRSALADWLEERGELDLARAVSGEDGVRLLSGVLKVAGELGRKPDVMTLFACHIKRSVWKHIYPQLIVRYPPGDLDATNPTSRSNHDYALYIADMVQNGSSVVFPDIRELGSDEPAWRIEPIGDD